MPEESQSEIYNQETVLPVQPGQRIVFVDILRGFAVFGILVANMAGFSGHTTKLLAQPAGIDSWVLLLIRFFITAKFYSLFSFLFGWGLSIQMARARMRGISFTSIYLRRLLVLLLIGVVHGMLIWSGDILTSYALLGFLLFLMRNRSERTILILMVLCLLLPIFLSAPWKVPLEITSFYENLSSSLRLELAQSNAYSSGSFLEITQLRIEEYLGGMSKFLFYFGNIFSMFLLGLWVGKKRIFQEVNRSLPLLQKVLVGGLILGVPGNALNLWLTIHPGEMPAAWLPQGYHQMLQHTAYTLGAPALMLFYVSGIILLLKTEYWHNLLSPLANVGRMALSNYLLQSILATLIFYNYGLGLFGEISPTFGLVLTVLIFLTQIRISGWWFDHYSYGPMEWIWRFLTYGKNPQSLSVMKGVPNTTVNRILRACHTFKKLNPTWILGLTWIILLVWAGLLITWHQQIEEKRQGPLMRQEISETTTQPNRVTHSNEAGQSGEIDLYSNPILTFQQKPYIGNIAAQVDVEELVETFDLERALFEIETLTGAPYWGRQAGSPQGWATGDYLANQFSHYGLQPLGNQGTYFQEFLVTYTPLDNVPRLYMESPINTAPEQFTAYQDFAPVVRWYAGSGIGKGQVFWMNRCAEEDFAAQDMVGEVLLCLPGTEQNWLAQNSRRALEHGAAALLFLTDPETWPPDFGWSFKDVWVPEPLPVFFVYPDMVNRLLDGSEKTITDLLANTQPFRLESMLGFEIETLQSSSCPGTKCVARNVIGILPGRDPSLAHEAIILSAHYDHMGQAPGGIVWPGANDDASGVAVMLEIARSWNEQGYIPKRSVIFIGWDAEELGLLGSIHYVQNPRFPLENTLAMLQLDMVGSGSAILDIDGTAPLGERIKHIAEALGIETRITNTGGSDHSPFLSTTVPASVLIWEIPPDGESNYHLPGDTVQMIEDERLRSAAKIVELTALNLVESEPSIQEMLASRARAAQEGNLEFFLSSSHPEQVQDDLIWFQDLQSFQPKRVSLEAGRLLIAGNHASADVRIDVDYLEPSDNITHTLTAIIPVTFTYQPSGWKWNGPQQVGNAIETSLDGKTAFEVSYPPGKEDGISGVGTSAIEKYQRIVALLGLSQEIQAKLLILESQEVLWGSTSLSQPRDRYASVILGEIKLVYSEAISTSLHLQNSLAQLALAQVGMSESVAPWLWEGLPLVLQGYDQPISTQIKYIPTLQQNLAQGLPITGSVYSWAATAYLQERLGWSGLGKFILKVGQLCEEGCVPEHALDATLSEFVNLDAVGFETAWQSTWQSQLETAQDALDTLLEKRNLAISRGDKQALLSTIDRSVPKLEIEEIHGLEDFQTYPPEWVRIQGRPLAFLNDSSLLAKITMEYQPAGDVETSTSYTILLTPSETGYYWAGTMMERLSGEQIEVLYPSGHGDLAAVLLHRTEEIYVRLASILDIPQTDKVILKLYDTPESYRASIFMPPPQTTTENGWTRPGESIKLNISGSSYPEYYIGLLANQLARSLLYQSGVDPSWLVEGIGAYLSRSYIIESSSPTPRLQTAALFEAAKEESMPALEDILPNIRLSSEELNLGRIVARDAVDFMISNYGWLALLDILDAQEMGVSLNNAFQTILGISIDQFNQIWQTSLLQRHVHPEWVETTQAFIPERAMESVDYLASPTLEGRQAGSTGSLLAAEYIAQAFEASGLLPAGDPVTKTIDLGNPLPLFSTVNLSGTLHTYFQSFPISYTHRSSIPRLELLDKDGELLLSMTYRQDFLLVQRDACKGITFAPLVWGGNQAYPDLNLEGKIILRTTSSDLVGEINSAISHGAAGLLLTNKKQKPEELYAKQPIAPQDSLGASIPIFEITQPGYSRLLEALGYDRQSIIQQPTFQSFEGSVRFECSPYLFETVQTNNVLGLLPGSDPYLSQEIVILSAHYDHVGDDPDGLRYSGANDDASGVAVLLELAHFFQEQGYRPKRSILFVAWGAQEPGQLGSNYYISNPLFPLQNTIAMIQLDGIGGGDGFNLGIQGSAKTDNEILFYLAAAEQAFGEKFVYTPPFNQSDDTPFRQMGIPSVLISWRLANDGNLPDELGNAVHPERLGTAGRVILLLLRALAR